MLSQWTNYKVTFGPWGINANHFFTLDCVYKSSTHWNFTCIKSLLNLTYGGGGFISRLSWKMWGTALFVTANVLITVWWIIPFICWRKQCHSVRKQSFHCCRCVSFSVTCCSSAECLLLKIWLWKLSDRIAFKWQPVWFNLRVFWPHKKNKHMLQWCMIALSKTQKSSFLPTSVQLLFYIHLTFTFYSLS